MEPDFDDLIDDYIEDSFEPPPELDEDEYLEEMMLENASHHSNDKLPNTKEDDEESVTDSEDDETSVGYEIIREHPKDLFSFERYVESVNASPKLARRRCVSTHTHTHFSTDKIQSE